MKLTIVCTALLFAAGLGTPRTAEAQNWQRITTEDQYRASIVGREIVTPEGHRFSSHADGRVTGQWGGQPMVGAWQWHQGLWCRNVRVGNNPETGTDCQLVEMRGNDVRKTRDQGRGKPGVGTLR